MLFWSSMNISATLTILGLYVVAINSIEITCKYDNYNKWMLNVQSHFTPQHKQLIYECIVTDIEIASNHDDARKVTNVSGIHDQHKSNEHVKSFGIGNRIVHFMPKELDKFFTNLIVLDVYATGLQEIVKDDLKPFKDLKYLSLTGNELQTIDFDLFVYNPHLEVVLLWGNKIETVNDAFENLLKLQYLSFKNNPCHSGVARHSHNQLTALIKEIHNNCEPDYEKAFEQAKSVLKMIQQNEDKLIVGSSELKSGQNSVFVRLNVIYAGLIVAVVNFRS
ncbi:uncharacterized protein [Chironomus tepperi]|uniref:uncharacterized protein n=1 Tax=Chironomus tepperi TaxID=113505 RepID=UPI00391F4146